MFNKRIRDMRLKKELTQKQVGDYVGVSHNTVANWERGERHPDYDILISLANLFDCTIDYLLGRTNDINKELVPPKAGEVLIVKAKNANVDIKELEAYIEARKKTQEIKD